MKTSNNFFRRSYFFYHYQANDLSVSAVEEIKQNSKFNSVENKVQANCADAIELLTAHRGMVK